MNGDNIEEYDFDALMLALRDLIAKNGIGNVIEGLSDNSHPAIVTLPLDYVTKITMNHGDNYGVIVAKFPFEDGAWAWFNVVFYFDYPYNVKLMEINERYASEIKIYGIMQPAMIDSKFVVTFVDCRIMMTILKNFFLEGR